MSKSKFKVGDIVRCVNENHPLLRLWEKFIVTYVVPVAQRGSKQVEKTLVQVEPLRWYMRDQKSYSKTWFDISYFELDEVGATSENISELA